MDIHPAFGFEWKSRWELAVNQRDASIRLRGDDPEKFRHREWGDVRRVANNVSKILGYLPGLHIIIGLARMALAYTDCTRDPEKRAIVDRHFIRGAGEVIFGMLLIIPDMIKTIGDLWAVQRRVEL